MQNEDFQLVTPVLPTRELGGAEGRHDYNLRIATGSSRSTAQQAPNDSTLDLSRQPLSIFRGAVVEVDARQATRVVLTLCLTVLAAAVVSLFVAGAQKNAEITSLHQHGIPVEVTVTRCFGLLGGSGSNATGHSCRGTYVLDGQRYSDTIPGDTLRPPGTAVRVVTAENDPGLLETFHQVESEHANMEGVHSPDRAPCCSDGPGCRHPCPSPQRPGPSAQSVVGSGRRFAEGSLFWGSEGGV